jgi:hypothetical protein
MEISDEKRAKYQADIRTLAKEIAEWMKEVPLESRGEEFAEVFEIFAPTRGAPEWKDLFSDELALFLTNSPDEAQLFLEYQNEDLTFPVKVLEDGEEWLDDAEASMDKLRDLDTLAAWKSAGINISDAIYGAIRGDVNDALTRMGFFTDDA